MRVALDPNESYKPGLAIAAVLLLLYVVLVGPVNFRFIGKRGTPTLALLTTPALAALGLVAMLGVGYIGKGVLMRYRRVEVSEAIEGERFAPSRRYTSLFLTRPVVFDLDAPARGALTMVPGGMGDVPPTTEHPGGATHLRDVRGRSGRRSSRGRTASRISTEASPSSATDGASPSCTTERRRPSAARSSSTRSAPCSRRATYRRGGRRSRRRHGTPPAPGGYYGGTTIDPAGSPRSRATSALRSVKRTMSFRASSRSPGGTLASPPLPTLVRASTRRVIASAVGSSRE